MLEDICNDDLWEDHISWNTTSPDVSICLQSTFLVWIPCLFLWVLLPFEIWQAHHSKRVKLRWSAFSVLKLALNVLLVIFSAMNFTSIVQRFHITEYPSDIASILGTSIMVATHVFVLVVTLHREQKGLRVSYILFIFWLFWAVATWVMVYSEIQKKHTWGSYGHKQIEYVAILCTAIAVTCQLVLSCFTEPNRSGNFLRLEPEQDNCPMTSNSPLKFLLFAWITRCMLQGMNGRLEARDLPPICFDLKSQPVTNHFESALRGSSRRGPGLLAHERLKQKISLVYLLWCVSWKSVLIGSLFELGNIGFDYLPPFMLQKLLNFIANDEPYWHGYLYGVLFCIGSMMSSICYNLCDYGYSIASLKMKTALTSAMYKKIFRLSPSSREKYTSGEILNMMSTDVYQISSMVTGVSNFWGAPLRIVLTLLYLWQYLGYSSLASIAVMLVLFPFSIFQGRVVEKLQLKVMSSRDERMKQMSEILSGIKILKLYAWEKPFTKRVLESRKKELNALAKSCYLDSFFVFLWTAAPFVVCAACFASFVLSGHTLDPSTAFVCLTLFNLLRFPMGMLSHIIVQLITAAVSKRRLEKFLNAEDATPNEIGNTPLEGHSVSIENASMSWSESVEIPTLKNINLRVKKGSLVAMVGTVGSGKSSLFSAVIGDMYKLKGTVDIEGSIAYVPQQAWIQNATVQRNILFTKRHNERMYNKMLDACALLPDLKLLPGGDQTEIGEKGINLSGGQKQRISLARAGFQDADVYLFDDPLSAVDANVASHIFKELIGPSGILNEKTRILATHNISFLPEMDHIVVFVNGEIAEEGSYSELIASRGSFADLIEQHSSSKNKTVEEKKEEIAAVDIRKLTRTVSVLSKTSDNQEQGFSPLTGEEEMETGRVTWAVYSSYITSIGLWIFLIIFAFNGLCTAAEVGSGVWLSKWTDHRLDLTAMQGLGWYCGFVLFQSVLVYLSYIVLFIGTIKAAANLHAGLLNSIIRAPLSFFDVTPTGRIMNRFSNDIETIDIGVPWSVGLFLNQLCWLPALLIVILCSSAYLLILIVPMIILYFIIMRAYVITSNQLQRFSSVSSSPVLSNFTETIQGVGSIRAFKVEEHFVDVCYKRVDENNKCSFYSTVSQRWLDASLSVISAVIVLAVTFIAIVERGHIAQGMMGLILAYCIQVTQGMNWLVKMGASLEASIVSVERIREYSCLDSEGEWDIADTKPPCSWPNQGEIVVNDFSTCYREDLDPVLKNVNLKITPGTKMGIVGRTGAGKSSFILSLFRIIEPTTGSILIDGVDITKIGIHDLRSKLTIIPQDPVLFGVSLRLNLDPWNENSDDEIWRAIELSHLKTFVTTLEGGLEFKITEGGDNLSAGQRQLVCLARALLRKTKILVLDEATASVDLDTDQLIQNTVREAFNDCTVITIAHRLQTIMKCDQIVVFSEGRLIENDTPENLLKMNASHFYNMAKDAGIV